MSSRRTSNGLPMLLSAGFLLLAAGGIAFYYIRQNQKRLLLSVASQQLPSAVAKQLP
jgi:hypothetical protein